MVPNTIKLAEKLLSEGKKVVIGTCYDEELYTLQKYFGSKCVIYNGKMNSKQKDAAQKAFIDDPNVTIFLGQLFAAGVGLTLVVSNCVIFNNIDYVPSTCQQFEDRVYRIGQTKDVDIYYQFFNNTQYERIWRLVLKKDLAINSVIKKEGDK